MKYFLVLLFSYLSILFVLSSCDKKCYDENTWGDDGLCPDADQSFEDMKAWYYFKVGSYWIYQEQNTGQIDTFAVDNDQETGTDSIIHIQWTAESTQGNIVTYVLGNSGYKDCNEKPGCPCHTVFTVWYVPPGWLIPEYALMYPLYEGNWIENYDDLGTSTVISVKNHLEFGDFLFYNVAEFKVTRATSGYSYETEYKYAKNVGMIERKNSSNNEHWKLIGYHIVQ